MNGGADDERDLEVIDLEPAARSAPERHPDSGVRRRRGPLVVAVVVVVALVVSVVASRSKDHDHSKAASSPSTGSAGKTVIRLHGGGLFPFRVGARVLTGGDDGLRIVDTDTGSISVPNVVGLPAGPVTVVASSGGTVAVRVDGQMYWFTLTEGMARRVAADTAFPAADTGYVWLAGDRSATEVPGGPNRLHRARVDTTAPALGATRRGLLERTSTGYVIQPVDGTSATEPFLNARAIVIGVHPDRVAWVATSDCGVLRCPVHVTEVATGATTGWIQLANHPDPIALADAVAYFAPDGGRVAIVMSDNNVTHATSMLIADLRAKRTHAVATTGYVTAPARPGTNDGAGATVAWTGDGSYLALAPAAGTGDGRLAVVDPDTARVTTARLPLDLGASAGVIGESTLGALPRLNQPDRPRSIATDERPVPRPGLQLLGADDRGVDVLDLGTRAVRSFTITAPARNPAGSHSIARVKAGWLVVRGDLVDLIRDGETTASLVDGGTQVFSADEGRRAWIFAGAPGNGQVETYDPATGAVGNPIITSRPVAAVDDGLVVLSSAPATQTLSLLDPSGRTRVLAVVNTTSLDVRGAGGNSILYSDGVGLRLLEAASGTTRTLDLVANLDGAISPDGRSLAWVQATGAVFTQSQNGPAVAADFIGPVDRVLVADDGTILATEGEIVREGRVGSATSFADDDLSLAQDTELALG